jgi:tRNA pseudouridine32 synthase/23S rRNA pseudouridine746 synthase
MGLSFLSLTPFLINNKTAASNMIQHFKKKLMQSLTDAFFIKFDFNTEGVVVPEKFCYPFYYEPHPLSVFAAMQLMEFLDRNANSFGWEFGLIEDEVNPRGRMFGVLIVENKNASLGFLAAYSGNISIHDKGFPFVPPVFDFWEEDGFYLNGLKSFEVLTAEIHHLQNSENFIQLKEELRLALETSENEINEFKKYIESKKTARDLLRTSITENTQLSNELNKESTDLSYAFKRLKKDWKEKIALLKEQILHFEKIIDEKIVARKLLSNGLQESIYNGFQFLNINGQSKGLSEIFADTSIKFPPSGAGECAAPRLLQHAFKMGYKPVTMAEFWWGASSKDEMRQHKQFYPACRGKCQPILAHMLAGIEVEDNVLLAESSMIEDPKILFEDEYLMVISKPAGLLSVPGKEIQDSVYTRFLLKYPMLTGPLTVHRLDMDTSGLMLIAKNVTIYKTLQAQFIQRKVKKRYLALLEGLVKDDKGIIELPLIEDYINRPRQIVSFEDGKKSITHFEVIERNNGRTLINFYPLTGRTHQLRVHAAHHLGLSCPIVGDDLYGKKDKRLCLHASEITFLHPVSKEILSFRDDLSF